jgi:hypothetical protein
MTVALVTSALDAFAKVLDAAGAKAEANSCRTLTAGLGLADPKKKIAVFLETANPRREVTSSWTGAKVRTLLPALKAFNEALMPLSGKVAGEMANLLRFLESFEHADVADLVAAMRAAKAEYDAAKATAAKKPRVKTSTASVSPQSLTQYAERLKSALGREREFRAILAELKADKSMKTAELHQIAALVVPFPPENKKTKTSALKALEDFHLAALGYDLKGAASHGRSAA